MVHNNLRKCFLSYVPVIGGRPDTQCASCGIFGHDHRAIVCPVTQISTAMSDGSFVANVDEMIPKLEQLRKSLSWHSALPKKFAEHRVEVPAIYRVFDSLKHGPTGGMSKR
jgi:hypothetical protein